MNKKKTLIIGGISILLVVGVILLIVIIKNNKKVENILSEISSIEQYFLDTRENETSIWALLENGYIEDAKEDKCNIYQYENEKIAFKEKNCDKALEIAKKPVVQIVANNDFVADKWNNKGTTLNIKFKNGGNSFYKEEDIKTINWYSIYDEFKKNGNGLAIADEECNANVEVSISLQDLTLNKKINVLIDKTEPVLEYYNLENEFNVSYNDNVEVDKVFYYLGSDYNVPSRSVMKENIEDTYSCGEEYYVWAYAQDIAGNKSEIKYLGKYQKQCEEKPQIPSAGGGKKTSK